MGHRSCDSNIDARDIAPRTLGEGRANALNSALQGGADEIGHRLPCAAWSVTHAVSVDSEERAERL